MNQVNQVITGALAMGFVAVGVFFLRFWKHTGDRLFVLFAFSFFVMSINRVLIGLHPLPGAGNDNMYWVRLVAFGLILGAILDKNRSQNRTSE